MKFISHSLFRAALAGVFAVLSGAALAAPSGQVSGATNLLRPASNAKYVPGEILVKFKSGVSPQAGTATVAALGGAVKGALVPGVLHVRLSSGQSVQAAVASYSSDPNVEYAQPNYIYHLTAATPSTATQYGQQWAFKNTGQTISANAAYLQPIEGFVPTIDAAGNPGTAGDDMHIEPAWGVITDCSSVVVAVIDSGVNYNHQELAANMWSSTAYPLHGANFTNEGAANDPMDLMGHGTHVAGIIGAAGNTATGVCWKAKIMAVRVFDSAGQGATTANIIQGINFAVTNGAKVINMSLGCEGCAFDQAYSNAITAAQTADVVVVVSAGNSGNDNDALPDYPCNFTQPNLICVAALDQAYNLASFSDWGATSVDVGAPGTNILSTFPGTTAITTDSLAATPAPWTATAGWGYNTWTDALGGTHNMITDPATYPNGLYPANAKDDAYKNFNLGVYNAATLFFYLGGAVNVGDTFGVAMSSAGGNPFTAAGGVLLGTATGFNTVVAGSTSFASSGAINITRCVTTACTLGFELTSAATSTGAAGPAVTLLSVQTLALNSTSYEILEGTSMASPMVAGLATMLRAYNPNFTYADVVAAIKNAGRATPSLTGKTTTGKAIDATASLAYINQPAGLAATVK